MEKQIEFETKTPIVKKTLSRPVVYKKECYKCHETKSLDEFPKSKLCLDGYESQCKKCKYQACKDKKAVKKQEQIKKTTGLKAVDPTKFGRKPSKSPKTMQDPQDTGKALDPWTDTATTDQIFDDLMPDSIEQAPEPERIWWVEEEITDDLPENDHDTGFDMTKLNLAMKNTQDSLIEKEIDLLFSSDDPSSPFSIHLDFTDHADIYRAIQTIAADEFRTPEKQVLFWLRQHLISSGESRYHQSGIDQG